MPSTVECPLCKRMLNLPEDGAGQSVRCPVCYGVFTVDAPASVSKYPLPSPAKPHEAGDTKRRRQEMDDVAQRRDRARYRDDDDDDRDFLPDRPLHFRPHRGGAIQTLGILSIVLCCMAPVGGVLGLIGLLMGQFDLAEMDADRMDPTGRGVTQSGKTCAIVGLVLSVAIFLLFFLTRMGRIG